MIDCRVAVAQMLSSTQLDVNLKRVHDLVERAARKDVQCIVLPENAFCFSSNGEMYSELYGRGVVQSAVANLSKQYKMYIVVGSLALEDDSAGQKYSSGKCAAALLVYSHIGECVARYNKLHLFDVNINDATGSYRESDSYVAGSEVVCIDTPWFKLGLSICYDLRFPELYRVLKQQGAEVVVVPSAFTHVTGEAHWYPLLQARAIENQVYVLAANQGGEHDNCRSTYGHSCVIDPWGEVVVEAEYGETLLVHNLSSERLSHVREQIPCADHQRLYIKNELINL